jgi:D-alanine-D-alanine ligase
LLSSRRAKAEPDREGRMNVTILTYLEQENAAEHDVVVDQVAKALRQGGHKPSILGVHGDIGKLVRGVRRRKPDLVFNLMETFGDTQLGSVGVVGLLDLLGVPYTGGGPGEFHVQEDKALAKKLLAYDKIPYPDFAVFSQDAGFETGGQLRLPLFVKPLRMDASIGIDGKSLVHTSDELLQRVRKIQEQVHDAALAEEYIEGREFYIGVLGNAEPLAFPPIEMDFSGLPDGKPHILDAKAKWDEKSAEFKGTRAVLPELADELRARLQKVALDACRALRVRDYGRVDMRLTETGAIYVIEVNASCYLEESSEFASAAAAAGLDYVTLVNRIAELAVERRKEPLLERRERRRGEKREPAAAPAP